MATRASAAIDSNDGIPITTEGVAIDTDGIPNYFEPNNLDSDKDGVPNQLDSDDDGDGTPTASESPSGGR